MCFPVVTACLWRFLLHVDSTCVTSCAVSCFRSFGVGTIITYIKREKVAVLFWCMCPRFRFLVPSFLFVCPRSGFGGRLFVSSFRFLGVLEQLRTFTETTLLETTLLRTFDNMLAFSVSHAAASGAAKSKRQQQQQR